MSGDVVSIKASMTPTISLQIVILLGLVAMAAADSDEFRGYGAPRVSHVTWFASRN